MPMPLEPFVARLRPALQGDILSEISTTLLDEGRNAMQGKIAVLLREVGKTLCRYLQERLPRLHGEWWRELVVGSLTFQQRRTVEQNASNSLEALDVAALLRVFDQNWHLLSRDENMAVSDRNYLKEMQTVRNRWAHPPSVGIQTDDAYRDLDTMQRFAKFIGAEDTLLDAMAETKRELLAGRTAEPSPPVHPHPQDESEFQVGQVVALRANPEQTGAVVNVVSAQPENRYSVFQDGKVATYYASQLQPVEEVKEKPEVLTLADFHARLSGLQIRHPSVANLYSINAGKIDFVPYQFRPVLKFIRSDRPRLLIADGVGVGKTIEAGLILRELQARRDIRSVLVICPKPLVVERKWERELKRFDERFTHLNGPTLRFCIEEMDLEGEWPEQHAKTILPYSLFNEALLLGRSRRHKGQENGLLDLDPPPRFDLVIVDEAHRISNPETYVHQGVRFFCEHAEAVVFLTATPIQLGAHDLFVLLNVLRPDLVLDRQAFEHMAAPNKYINQAIGIVRSKADDWQAAACGAMEEAASTPWGCSILQNSPDFQSVYDILGKDTVPDEERVGCITALEQLHTFSNIINRMRRRDIGQFTVRRPETVKVSFTKQQRDLHDAILHTQARIFSEIRGHSNVKFMMTTIRRQAASCLFGLAPLLKDILTRHIDELTWAEADESFDAIEESDIGSIEAEIVQVLQKAEELSTEDPKLSALLKIIADKQKLPNNKIMIFSGFRHTLGYLLDRLRQERLRVGMVHGGTPDEDRVALRECFQRPKEDGQALDILLFSEVGCEGLDYEFCDCMVNFDLPWNPMRIEQRIGRIDRRGQKSDSVSIFNLITPGTVDADIYDRCLLRIGVFSNEIGGGEEILGEITQGIRNIAEDISLTPEQQSAKLQQLADNKIRLIQEQQELEGKQMELFGLKIPEDQAAKEVENAASYWLSPEALQNLLSKYLSQACADKQEHILGDKALKTLRLSQEARERLIADFRNMHREKSPARRVWETWLKGSEQHLAITFDPACAVDSPDTSLINPLHPAIRQAAEALSSSRPLVTGCQIADRELPKGEFPFAIYQWQFRGFRENLSLQGVSTHAPVADRLMELLEKSEPWDVPATSIPSDDVLTDLDKRHYDCWALAREQHRDHVRQLVEYRRESLNTSHSARMALLREQLGSATNENIRRMRQSQINTAEADYRRHCAELDQAVTKADVTAEVVAYGIVRVYGS